MTDETVHEDNATPDAADDVASALNADTPGAPDGAAVADQGVGSNPTESTDTDENDDPKSGGTPVHPAPGSGERDDDDAVDG